MGGQELTGRETEVLHQIVAGKSNKEIGSVLFISEATVKTHINSLLSKLGLPTALRPRRQLCSAGSFTLTKRLLFAQRRKRLLRMMASSVLFALALAGVHAQEKNAWHTASESELKALIPARAPVEKERIETEFRTASGITDGEHRFIAGVVLITAGYSAEGKYSHFLIVQAPIKIGEIAARARANTSSAGRTMRFADGEVLRSSSRASRWDVEATLNPSIKSVPSFRVWPPADKSVMQIGRFSFPYHAAPFAASVH
jgi:hypothetical protein